MDHGWTKLLSSLLNLRNKKETDFMEDDNNFCNDKTLYSVIKQKNKKQKTNTLFETVKHCTQLLR